MRRALAVYGLTTAAVAVAWVCRWLLDPWLGDNLPFLAFYFAVIFSAWYGGFAPGMLSLALGIAAGSFFFDLRQSSPPGSLVNQLGLLRFGVVGVCVSLVCEILHRQRRQIETRRELLRVTLASIGDAVLTTDTEGRITYLNSVAESVTGWTQAEAVGRPLDAVFHVVHEETRQPVTNPALRALREGIVVGLANHTVLIRKDGTERAIGDSAAPIKDERGHVSGSVLIFRDISDRRGAERRIDALMIELKEADRRKDEFLATLAHELRNPLTPLRNMLEIMKHVDGDGDVRARARDTMARQLEHLVRLVDDLLDVSRITQNKLELRLADVALAPVLQQAVEAIRTLAEQAHHELRMTLPPQPVYVRADPVRLAQVFSNLLNNSCKYTPEGGRIWLAAERQGSDVLVTVKDTGSGIPVDKLDVVFDMFMQVDRSLERSKGGLGIGLTLVKRLVQMHGGSIEARSEGEGRGSEFTVRLPMLIDGRATASLEAAAARPPTRTRRILVVDDNRDSAASLVMLLKITGHDVHEAHDGVAALEAAERLRPEVVLLDIGLPKLSGHEVCRRLREQPWGKAMVLVALTGWGQEEDRRKSREAGFDAHLVKPVEHAALLALLDSLVPSSSCYEPTLGR